ncbi:hypothetical protein [Pseudomonas sp. RGM2987]|uniref:hypothetical protein n=1 Tax=Pseudomonas sp. RGM2987 TaxID=2930090 RepID=UPI001FD64B13|nr:hypothetical protein [Pseudomonas sp. RGM2987]MCJ8206802.1 hypothetical protein [Pseudomonas sp. RGM2987]
MKTKISVTEKFEMLGGVTILVCKGFSSNTDIIGKQFYLVSGSEVRQTLTIIGVRDMLNQQSNLDQKALETRDVMNLSKDEARSGSWKLILG